MRILILLAVFMFAVLLFLAFAPCAEAGISREAPFVEYETITLGPGGAPFFQPRVEFLYRIFVPRSTALLCDWQRYHDDAMGGYYLDHSRCGKLGYFKNIAIKDLLITLKE